MSEIKVVMISDEELEELREKHSDVEVFDLNDMDGNYLGEIACKRPSATVIEQFERFIDTKSFKARDILIKGTLLTRKEEIKGWPTNSSQYSAVFDACAQMLPAGKAQAKKR